MPFYHFDVYRIGDVEEMEEIGYEDYFYGEGVCLIEWANLIEEIHPLPIARLRLRKIWIKDLTIVRLPSKSGRKIE